MKHLLVVLLAFFLAACVGDHSKTVDVAANYDAFGVDISPLDAVPVQAVVADGAALVGKPVKIEGRITEVCQGMGCWLSFQIVDGPLVRIDVPRDENGEYLYTFPKDASGRRAIISGILAEGSADHDVEGDMDHHAEEGAEGHDEAETRVLNQSVYTLTATGALIERVRA